MKNKCLKSILLLLSAVLTLGSLFGCSSGKGQDSDTTTSDPIPVREEAHIAASDLKDYVLIIPQDAGDEVVQAAIRFRDAVNEAFGVMLSVSDDSYRFFAKDKIVKPCEILLDRTNREETTAFLKTISYGDAGCMLLDKKLVLCGSTEELTVQMVDAFIEELKAGDVFYTNQNDRIQHSPDTVAKKDLEIAGLPLSAYRIVYEGSDTSFDANQLYHGIGRSFGVCLPLIKTENIDTKTPVPSILFHCAKNVDKSLVSVCSYEAGEYGYCVHSLSSAPQILLDGENLFLATLAEKEFVNQLANGTEVTAESSVRKTLLDEEPSSSEPPIQSVRLAGGDLSQYRIVFAEEPTGKTAYAAQELAKYLEKATGIQVPVVLDTEDPINDLEIVIGITSRDTDSVVSRRAKLENDGIVYYMEGNRLFLTSHTDAGQIYAVYHFLEDYLGCRFYANDFESIRFVGEVDIPADLDYAYSSPLFYRYTDWGLDSIQRRKLGINQGEDVMYEIVGSCHTLGALSETGSGITPNPCLCDEKIYQTVLKNVRAKIEATPNCRVISVTQNDTYKRCECEKCKAMEEAENPSGLMLTFVNRLAEDIEKYYPDVKILTFAYQYTRKPPKTVKARKNVLIWLCSIECCFYHTLNDPSCEKNTEFAADIAEWSNYCEHMYVWDYVTSYRFFSYPFPNLMVLRQNLAFFVDRMATGIYEEGGYLQFENGEFARLRSYLLGKLMWDPYMTEEEYNRLMNEFLEDYYGAGWQYIRDFIDITSTSLETCMGIYEEITPDSFSVQADYLSECFDRAIAAATDNETRRHCALSALQMDALRTIGGYNSRGLRQKLYDAGVRYLSEANPITIQ